MIREIEQTIKCINKYYGDFFKKYNLELKLKAENQLIFANNLFDFDFMCSEYTRSHKTGFHVESIYIVDKIGAVAFARVINFIQSQKGEKYLDWFEYKGDKNFLEYYASFLDSHLIPFLKMKDSKEKLNIYLKGNNPRYE